MRNNINTSSSYFKYLLITLLFTSFIFGCVFMGTGLPLSLFFVASILIVIATLFYGFKFVFFFFKENSNNWTEIIFKMFKLIIVIVIFFMNVSLLVDISKFLFK